MNKIKYILLIFALLIVFTGCNKKDSYLKDINYKELTEKLDNNEEFFFIVSQDGCSHCEEFIPIMEEVLNDYKVTGYNFNLTNISDSDKDKFYEVFTNITGTPTTIFVKDGKEISVMQRIVGVMSYDKLVQKLKSTGYIK